MCIVLVALGASPVLLPVLLPVDRHDEAEPTSTGLPCVLLANGEELCGHDAAIWCNLEPNVEAEPGLPGGATRDVCARAVRWTSY